MATFSENTFSENSLLIDQ